MANYLARVELHGVTQLEDYNELHAAMEVRGFVRQIQDDERLFFQLPTGTYVAQNTDVTLDAAHDLAVAAVTETGYQYSLIVVEWPVGRFTGLDQVLLP